MIKKIFFLAGIFQMYTGYAQTKHRLSIREAVELAYKNVVELKNLMLDYKIQEAKNRQIVAQALPQIGATAGMQYYFKLPIILFPDASQTAIYSVLKKEGVKDGSGNPITNIPVPTLQQVSFQQPWNASVGAQLTQLLFQPDVFVGLEARKTSLVYAQQNIDLAKEKIKDSAYKRYYAILIAEKQLLFIHDGVKRLEKLLHDNEILYKNGFVEKLDIDKTQVQLTNLQTSETSLHNAINLAYAALKYTIGIPQNDTVQLKDSLSVENLKLNILVDTFNYQDRKEITLLTTAKQLQKLDLKRNKMSYIPTLSAVAAYSVSGQAKNFILSDKTAIWPQASYVGLNLNISLFDGLARKSKIEESRWSIEKIENTLTNVQQAIDLEQTINKESFKNAILKLDAQQRNIKLAEEVYNTTKKKYEQGLGSSFEVLQGENDLQQSQSNYFTALYEAIVAKINYQQSIGKLE